MDDQPSKTVVTVPVVINQHGLRRRLDAFLDRIDRLVFLADKVNDKLNCLHCEIGKIEDEMEKIIKLLA